jgi:transposase
MDIAAIIDLSDITITEVTKNEMEHLFITVETTESSIPCHKCGKELKKRHGSDSERCLRHLHVFGKPTHIIYKPHRYICDDCDNNSTTATPDWHKQGSQFTVPF